MFSFFHIEVIKPPGDVEFHFIFFFFFTSVLSIDFFPHGL